MQKPVIMAFRKRLKKRGYTDISICKERDSDEYVVNAAEPLAHVVVTCKYTIVAMYNSFRF